MLLQAYDFVHLYDQYGCLLRSAAATSGATLRPGLTSLAAFEGHNFTVLPVRC